MNTTCKNCNHHTTDKYCSHCGQPTDTHRLNYHSIWEDVRHGLLHFSDELVFTTKQLFTRPGHTIREYIAGKRVDHFSPISFVIFVASMYGVINILFNIHMIADSSAKVIHGGQIGEDDLNHWIAAHYSWFALFSIPLFAVMTFYAFKRQGYNFAEHLIINAFLTGQRFVFLFILFPIAYLLKDSPYLETFRSSMILIEFALRFWALDQLFTKVSKIKIFFLLLLCYLWLLAFVTGFGLLFINYWKI
jgi:hypothetical protein